MATSPCPNESQLRAYLLGEGNTTDLEAIAKHLEGCPTCERLIQSMEMQTETLLGRLRSAFPQGSTSEQVPDDLGVTRPMVGEITDALSESTYATQYARQPNSTVRANIAPRPDSQLAVGTAVRYFGDYEIQSVIGRGGMGVVYRAKQVSLNRPVALKMIKVGVLADDSELRRFQNEAEAVALLDHPGIVPLYEVGEHDGQRYFSMKLIEGGNLADGLSSFKDDLGVAVAMLVETTDAVQHAHIRGVLHRDLKPANILIDTARHPHITDFGLAKRLESNIELTATGAVMGTPAYMSPEQAAGHRDAITTATDVYGLGAILYALLTGKAPFGCDSVIETLDAVRTRLPVAPRKLNAKVHRDLELICLKCLEKNPIDRYPTAAALADDLRRFAAGEPVSVRVAGFVERSAKWARRKPTLAAAYSLGSLALLFCGLGGTAAWQWQAAIRARDSEATARQALAQVEYGRTMEGAHQEWRNNNIATTIDLIEGTRPDFRGWEWDYLNRLCHGDLFTLKGHTKRVNTSTYSPDGTRILTSSDDRTARAWDARTGVMIFELKGHDREVISAYYSPKGLQMATASHDGTAVIWDAKTGTKVFTLRGHNEAIRSLVYSPDGTRIATENFGNSSTTIWDAKTGLELVELPNLSHGMTTASFSPDGSRIVLKSEKTARVWSTKTGAEILKLTDQPTSIDFASFSLDGSRVVTKSDRVKIWNTDSGAELLTLKDSSGVDSIWLNPDGSRILTCGHDGSMKVWDIRTGAEICSLKGLQVDVFIASFSRDGSRIITANDDRGITVWDGRTGNEIVNHRGHTGYVFDAAFSPDGSHIATASDDHTAKVWEAATDGEISTLIDHGGRIHDATFSPDGSRIVTASSDHTAKVWDARLGTIISTLTGHQQEVQSVKYSHDGIHILTASNDKSARIWNAKTGALVQTLVGHEEPVRDASFSPDGSRVVTASDDHTAKIWDIRTGDCILTLRVGDEYVRSASFSPDGSRILVAGSRVRIWDSRSGTPILEFKQSSMRTEFATFSPDGSRVVTARIDKTAAVWDANTGVLIHTLKGHAGLVLRARFNPDGSRIITASTDGTARIWDAKSGVEVLNLKASKKWISSASFSSDGLRVVTAGFDGKARVWDGTPINLEIH